jgi:hypothetical protein
MVIGSFEVVFGHHRFAAIRVTVDDCLQGQAPSSELPSLVQAPGQLVQGFRRALVAPLLGWRIALALHGCRPGKTGGNRYRKQAHPFSLSGR